MAPRTVNYCCTLLIYYLPVVAKKRKIPSFSVFILLIYNLPVATKRKKTHSECVYSSSITSPWWQREENPPYSLFILLIYYLPVAAKITPPLHTECCLASQRRGRQRRRSRRHWVSSIQAAYRPYACRPVGGKRKERKVCHPCALH